MSTLVALAHARMASLPIAYFKENDVKAMWQWELTDPQHPNCQVVSSQKKKADFSGP